MRGEYSFPVRQNCFVKGSPPLARGIPHCGYLRSRDIRITPACAGNTFSHRTDRGSRRDHPRLRGEYFGVPIVIVSVKGSPPLARGILFLSNFFGSVSRITPACAGNTLIWIRRWMRGKDHPRLRGEYT